MKSRLITNWVTSVIGILIIAFCFVLAYQGKHSPEELAGWFATALLFLRSKDSIINLPKE